MIEVKILKQYFDPLIEGKKPFEIRKNDRPYKVGAKVKLEEYAGKKYVPECEYYKHMNCEYYEDEDVQDGYEEAINICNRNRYHCGEHYLHQYTGRTCTVVIKDIFPLRLPEFDEDEYIAFTFDIVDVNVGRPIVDVEELN